MTLILALTVGVLFGSGAYLLLKRGVFRIVVGIVLVANAANLTLMASARTRGESPIYPLGDKTSDPLVQAMTVTAVIIGFAITALLLSLAYRVYLAYGTMDLDAIEAREVAYEEELEREEVSV